MQEHRLVISNKKSFFPSLIKLHLSYRVRLVAHLILLNWLHLQVIRTVVRPVKAAPIPDKLQDLQVGAGWVGLLAQG